MTVRELIKALKGMRQDAPVAVWDDGPDMLWGINHVTYVADPLWGDDNSGPAVVID